MKKESDDEGGFASGNSYRKSYNDDNDDECDLSITTSEAEWIRREADQSPVYRNDVDVITTGVKELVIDTPPMGRSIPDESYSSEGDPITVWYIHE